jgi:hypothetical protein
LWHGHLAREEHGQARPERSERDGQAICGPISHPKFQISNAGLKPAAARFCRGMAVFYITDVATSVEVAKEVAYIA